MIIPDGYVLDNDLAEESAWEPATFPMSFAQQRLWFLSQMDEEASAAYHIPLGLRLSGTLDHAALRRALDRILVRHEALRTTFAFVDEQPVQRIQAVEESRFVLVEHDLRQHDDVAAELSRLTRLEAETPFDLAAGPLIRGRLVRLPDEQHALLLTMHHIVSDGWSMGILVNELSTLYGAFLRGEADPLKELEIQYADYALWQRRWIEGEILQQQAAYWKTALAGAPAVLELPADHPRPAQQDFAGAFAGVTLDEGLTAKLKDLSRRHGTTLFMTLLAGWAALLGRLSGQQDVVIGTPTANRGRAEIEHLIGFFVNTLTLRVDLAGSPSVGELLARAKAQALGAQQHQDIPFEQVVELAQPVRSLAHSPLFQVMFVWQNATAGSALDLPALDLQPLASSPHRVAKFDLTLALQEAGDSIVGGIEYATALFDPATIARYLGYFENLLAAMVEDDTRVVGQLPLLGAAERHQLLYGWNDTATTFPSEQCIHQLFEEQVLTNPEATAVVFEGAQLSYGELNRRSNQLARHLVELGVRPDTPVAICVERSFEMIVALLAVLKAGGAYVPLDPGYPLDRLQFMLDDSRPVALLTQNHLRSLFPDHALPVIDLNDAAGVWHRQPGGNLDPAALGLTPSHLAYIIYTSGSTGLPKGVMVQHRGLCNYTTWSLAAYRPIHSLVSSPLSFDATVTSLYTPLLGGGSIQLIREKEELDLIYAAVQTPVDGQLLKLTPSHLEILGRRPYTPQLHATSRSVHVVGGEALSSSGARLWLSLHSKIRLVNEYGPTETVVGCVVYEADGKDILGSSVPIGKPIANTQVYILDGHGEPVPAGVTGELYIGGAGVARGYLNRPELTAERFLADPFSAAPEARMYRTGDLGRWLPDGNIEFLGRNDFQVKLRGFRIELGEIEARLAAHPEVRDAVVIAREDTPGDKRLVAYYTTPDTLEAVAVESLRSFLSADLPEYMVPAAYVYLEELPLTPNGKLDRKALPAPETDAYLSHGYEPPLGEMETRLAKVWAEVLRLERVGRHDNFFELGGHSLLAVRVVSRLRQALSREVAFRDLFAHPVLADLAAVLDRAGYAELPAILPAERNGLLPVSFAQQRLWFLSQMDEEASAAYHIPLGLRLSGTLDHAALRRALDRILVRHEALRTTFAFVDEQPVQRIQAVEESRFVLVEHDLRQHDDVAAELSRLTRLEAETPFDLAAGPLIRGRLVRLPDEQHALLLTMHHIVSDGWSMGILVNELSTLYGAFLRGEADPLKELEIQYADYALWQRRWIEGEILQQQAAYWKTALAGAPAVLELPADHPRPAQQDFAGAFAGVTLDEGLTAKLKDLSRRHGTTLFMTLLAGWAALLGRLSGQQDVVIGTPTANRGRAEIEHLIGFFVNTLTLRVDLAGSPSVGELLARAKAQALGAQQHQDIPFEQVVELAQPVRSLAHSPLFQVMFVWQNATAGSALDLPALDLQPLASSPHRVAKFDLTLALQEAGDSIVGGIEYATALFDPATIARYLGYFENLLAAMVEDDTRVVGQLPLLGAAERHQLLYGWNDTATTFPSEQCIHQLFEEQVLTNPEATAVVFEGAQLSYGELNRRSNQLARHLVELGVRPDTPVAICVERSFEMIVALLAVLKAGGAYVPLDPGYPLDRLQFMLDDSRPVALLTQSHLRSLFPDHALPVIDLNDAAGVWHRQPGSNLDPAALGLTPSHLAYIIYTSGSTGLPKGVMVQHRSVVRLVKGVSYVSFSTQDRVLQMAPVSFDAATFEIWGGLLNGGRLIVMQHGTPSLQQIAGIIRDHNVTIAWLTAPLFHLMAEGESESLHSVKQLVAGGDILSPRHVTAYLADLPNEHAFINGYGPTEGTTFTCCYRMEQNILGTTVPIGKPIANTQVYILDGHGEPVPAGVTGELYIGGAGVARGYLNRPELTAERFLADPFSAAPEARMYRTGDLGRWLPDGNIEFLGRNDFQVKLRGFRIELGEIEARLAAHPEVRDAVVIAREDTPGDKRLVAYYTTPDTLEAVAVESLRSFLSADLPEYMVPAAYVYLEELPLTPNGKLDRKALPAPETDAYLSHGYEPPLGEMETRLAKVWAEVLRLERVGRHDNFFELGGHSLLAVTLIERVRKMGFKVDVRTLFATPTLAQLAAAVDSSALAAVDVPPNLIPAGCDAIRPEMLTLIALSQEEIDSIVVAVPGGAANVQDIYPLAPLQEGILFHHLMSEEGDPYLLALQFSFDTRARLDSYLEALQAVVNRHDILRTAVVWEGLTKPVQVVWRNARLHVEQIDLQDVGDASEQLYARLDPRHHRIDVRQAPLLRLYIAFDEKNNRWLMMQLLHHLSGDHTTLEVMQAEVQAYLLGQELDLPSPLPFRTLVAQARLGVSEQEHEVFFRDMLEGVDETTAPFGLLNTQGDGSEIEEAYLPVEDDLARRMRASARRLGVSVASLCHLAWAQVLAKATGRDDVVFGTVLFGRMQGGEGSDRVMGLFINTLPVRLEVTEQEAEAGVRKTHLLLSDLLRHEHASLALAQRCSGVPAPAPLFSALLNYRHSAGIDQPPSTEARNAWQGIQGLRSQERTNYPLTLSVNDFGQAFSLDVQTAASVGPLRICEFMHTALGSLVEALETDPARKLHTLQVLPAAERHQLLYGWNDTATTFPSEQCIHQLFEEQVLTNPEATAVVFEGAQLSYGELNRRSNQLARHLVELGVRPDTPVAICVERSFEMIVALLAVLKAGGAYVPLDPSYPLDRLQFMLDDSRPVALLTQNHLRSLFPDHALPVIDLNDAAGAWHRQPGGNLDPAALGLTPSHLAYIIYTSGSTGLPKGVMVQHRSVVRLVKGVSYVSFSTQDRVLQMAPVSFDAATFEIWGGLLNGGRLIVMQHGTPSLQQIAGIIRDHNVTIAWLTAPLFHLMAEGESESLHSVKQLVAGGDILSPRHVTAYLADLPNEHAFINGYGPTEGTTFTCCYRMEQNILGTTVPIGKPIANTQVYILDGHGEPVPAGVTGELYIGGAGVARGYLNRPELTAERFLADPFSAAPEARMYRTGDLGRWLPDGNIEFLGRNDFQVKLRGFRIELGEIEARLAAHPEVRDAVVIAREDTPGDKRLVAYYTTPDTLEAVAVESLRSFLSADLPEYMVPAAYVYLEELPLTPNGKLDRKALPAPETDAYLSHGYEPPLGEMETRLAKVWAEVLRLERVGRHDNFFELGGHSLLAVRVVSRLRQALSREVAFRDLFAHPVLADLAAVLDRAGYAELPAILPAERNGLLPVSFAQQRLWFLSQMDEEASAAYHIPLGLRLSGTLDHAALRRALDRILVRHEALRTTFAFVDEQPVQRIQAVEESRFVLVEHDLRQHDDVAAELSRLTRLEAETPFDLAAGPLIRGRLVRLPDEQHALLLTMHHIVSDGWSMGILVNELSTLYGAFLRGEADPLKELEIQYADYALWQRRWIEGEILQQQAAYWKTALAGAPAVLELPADHPRPAQQDFAGAFAGVTLDEGLTAKLKDLSRRHGTTLFMTLLAGWAALLGRLSGQQDVVIGTPTANRGRAEIEHLIGFFVNTLTLRVDLAGSPSVGELLARAKAQALGAQQHQDIPFEQVVELAQPVRSLAHSPLFQVMFVWQNATAGSALDLPALDLQPLASSPHRVAKFDLTLALQEAGDSIVGGIEYATALFDPATIARYLGYFENLLAAMVEDDTRVVGQLPLLGAAERHQLLYGWNDTATTFPSEQCIHQLFEEQVLTNPEATAVVFEGAQLSYGELNRRSNQLARHLVELGVRPDTPVAICVERSFEMIVALLAVLKAGGAYVPLDPSYPLDRLQFMLDDSRPVALLTQNHLRSLFPDHALPVIDLNDAAGAWHRQPGGNLDPAALGLTPSHLAYIIYTSGSTGLPKGVMVQHRGLCNYTTWSLAAYRPIHSLVSSPLSFDATVTSLYTPLLGGGSIQLIREKEELDLIYAAVQTPVDGQLLKLTPSHLEILGRRPYTPQLHATSRSVHVVGGEALSSSGARLWLSLHSKIRLVNEYGPTETVVGCVVYEADGKDILGSSVPIGKPIANTQVYILDGHGEPVPAGVTGELYIGGAGVARGYLNRPELTAERFLADPFSAAPEARMYRTGDLGRWLPDGNIEFLGRNDFQVKLRGFRIELGEIEARLAAHPEVRDAVVIAREDTPGDKRLVAYYTTPDTLEAVAVESLRSFLSADLPEYMVPAAYVYLEELPLTPNGKLDRKALPAPETDAYLSHGYEPPLGEMETRLAKVWAEVLRLERVGRHDNFFELGGHSLLAVTLIERVRKMGFKVDVRTLFATPTLAQLAAAVDSSALAAVDVPPNLIPAGCDAIRPEMLTLIALSQEEIDSIVVAVPGGAANVQDIYPLAPLQEGILFHHLMSEEGDPYLLALQFSFDTRARLDSYLEALQAVVNRHDILRTAVVWEGLTKPVQVVWRNARLHVEQIDLQDVGDASEQLYARLDPRHHRIDVRQAPLLRLYIAFDEKNNRWLMMQLLHHLSGDHTTLEVMQAEVQAYLLGQELDLPSPLPFRTLVAQARLGVSEQEHEVFFRDMLEGVDETTAPFGLLNTQGDGSEIEEAYLPVEDDLARRMRASARRLGVSVASLCHLAWAQVLAKATGRDDVVFGTVLFGRMQGGEGSDRVMGLFINTLPVRLEVTEQEAEAGVRKTHLLLSDLLRHEHASLALAQRCSGVPAPAPLFSALLNYRHSAGIDQPPSTEARNAWQGIQGLRSQERTNYPLTLSVNDFGQAFSLDVQTAASVGPLRICEFMHTALGSLVEALETDPTRKLHTLQVLPAAERHQLLYGWNDTATTFPSEQCIHQLFEEQVLTNPEATAVVFEGAQLSYGELNRRSNQLARHLVELGVRPDTPVAICVERSFEMIVALLAVLKAGGAYVPLDPSYPLDRLQFMLDDSRPVALLTQNHLRSLFPDHALPVIDLNDAAGAWHRQPGGNLDPAALGLTPSHLAYIIYTSGSTGLPKGVMVQHRSVVRLVKGVSYVSFSTQDRVLQMAPVSFDAATFEIWGGLLNGGRLIVMQHGTPSLQQIAGIIRDHNVTIAWLTAPLFHLMAEGESESLHSVKQLVAGGDILSPRHVTAYLADLPNEHAFINGYGPTEGTTFTCCYRMEQNILGTTVPIGKPIANTQVYILDGHGEPVPAGVTGELYIGGAGVARGYLNRPELTAERFLADPFSAAPEARMYRTGDLGRWLPDGNIEFLGRNDFQVKLRGFRIELGEIEARLAAHPEVRDAVVIAREDTPGDKRLVAYYTTPDTLEAVAVESLRSFLSADLPEYMVPAAYVYLEDLPLTPNGKLDRKALPAPETDASHRSTRARSLAEQILLDLFADILGLSEIMSNDDFFALGGNSLLAITLVSRVHVALGVNLSLHILFEHSTPKALIEHLSLRSEDRSFEVLLPIKRGGKLTPLFLFHPGAGLSWCYSGLIRYTGSERPLYGLQSAAYSSTNPTAHSPREMAKNYIDNIRRVQPDGPYLLAGWSSGGLLAFMVATLLEEVGETVSFLGLLDSFPSSAPATSRAELPIVSLEKDPLTELFTNAETLEPSKLESLYQKSVALNLLPAYLSESQFLAFISSGKSAISFSQSFTPNLYRGCLTLFIAARDTPLKTEEASRAWEPFVGGQIRTHSIDCFHSEMMSPQVLPTLGPLLATSLARSLVP